MKVAFRGGRELLANALKGIAPAGGAEWYVHLFKAYETFTPTTPPSDLTLAAFTGYGGQTANPPDQGPIVWDGDDAVVRLNNAPFIWDCTGSPEEILGWVLYDNDNDKLLFGEVYDTPHVLSVGSRHTLYADIAVGQCG